MCFSLRFFDEDLPRARYGLGIDGQLAPLDSPALFGVIYMKLPVESWLPISHVNVCADKLLTRVGVMCLVDTRRLQVYMTIDYEAPQDLKTSGNELFFVLDEPRRHPFFRQCVER